MTSKHESRTESGPRDNKREHKTPVDNPRMQQEVDTRQPASSDKPLPHERDESTGTNAATSKTAATPDPMMVQAHKDNKKGIVDTDRRSAYGLSEGLPSAKTENSHARPRKK